MFLEVNNINTFYGIFHAIFDVSIKIEKGEVVCLLGRNGAGKTTTLSSIVGLNKPRSGSVKFKGAELKGKKPHEIVRMGIGYVPENRLIFSDLTVRDNLELGCRKKTSKHVAVTLDKIFHLFPRLKELTHRIGGTLSGGEQQMLTIARTLMGEPELLLLDELTMGLAPIVVNLLREVVKTLKSENLTILLTEQNALFALDLSERVYVIDKGTIVYNGSVQDLKQNYDLMSMYLGV